ncbi:alpha-1,2-fucosyltransferase [Brachybacterium sp. HMSC06H03]|uniref:alpha-1,2-fucosyltransferase n=1 Tax=Brachybacterium sp. HMSC06H03 TaxID=1581127 RepID=UPI0009F53DA9|nr:alpha-1,2-fucosyltransferase [Brachybacterium sp. HMSC06H03]
MIRSAAESTARSLLNTVRERPGARTVQGSSDAIRGGNNLYLWQWAHIEQRAGRRAAVLRSATMPDWVEEFPLLRDLTIDQKDVSLLDRRRFATRFFFDHDFDRAQNRDFCLALVDSSDSFRDRRSRIRAQITRETLVVNVRRGDYYEVPEFFARFGLDVHSHVAGAVELVRQAGRPVDDVLVVSDDVDWCRRELTPVLGGFRTLEGRSSPFDDLASLSSATTLILANSTFSYWGSHLASSFDGEHLAIAPSHHEIAPGGNLIAPMFDPSWPRTEYSPLRGATG